MRVSSRLALLVVMALVVSSGLGAASPILAVGVPVQTPAFGLVSLRHAAPIAPPRPVAAGHSGLFGRMIGYRSAQAEERPAAVSPEPAHVLLFHHLALGVAELDVPSDQRIEPVGGIPVDPLPLSHPGSPVPGRPGPLPIPLIVVIVMGPALLLVLQALHGGPKVAVRPRRRRR